MTKRLFAFVAGLAGMLMASLAFAADTALMVPIGYSQNLRYFAFEEFGIQDGSGFAYSDIFMIDLTEDRWVVGTPIRVIAESEDAALSGIRARSRAEAQPYLDDLAIDVPAHLLASNADGEPDSDGTSLTFALPAPSGPGFQEGRFTLELELYPAESGAPCEDWFDEKATGFIMTLTDFASTREIHRDNVLPRSRGCPVDYRIHSVFAPFAASNIADTIALIAVYAHGFEGLDRRFIGVALTKSLIAL